jgi:hypothetical protein
MKILTQNPTVIIVMMKPNASEKEGSVNEGIANWLTRKMTSHRILQVLVNKTSQRVDGY